MEKRFVASIDALTRRRLVVVMSFIFIVAQMLYIAAGVRFDALSLDWAWHYLDPELLRTRLLESIWYLHSQPPLFNLFLGVVLKLAPGYEGLAFQLVYLGLGLSLYLAVFGVMRSLAVSRSVALLVSTLFMLSPSFVLYEHWLYYTFPIATLLAVSALLLQRLATTGQPRYAWGLFGLLAVLCGMRSLFHLGYYLVVGAGLLLFLPRYRRKLWLAILIPGLCLSLLYVKNFVLFGEFSASSWFGMSLWKISGRQLPHTQVKQWVAEDKLSPVSLIEVYSGPEKYPAHYRSNNPYAHIPALAQLDKSTGAKNLNHFSIIAIASQYRHDAHYVLRHAPQSFLIGVAGASFGYFKTSSDLEFLERNKQQISHMDRLYNYLFYGKIPYNILDSGLVPITSDKPQFFFLFLLLGLPLLLLNGLRLALGRRTASRFDRSQRLVIGYLCFNITYVALISSLFEIGENNRIRFSTDPLSIVLLGVAIQEALRVLRRKDRRVKAAGLVPFSKS